MHERCDTVKNDVSFGYVARTNSDSPECKWDRPPLHALKHTSCESRARTRSSKVVNRDSGDVGSEQTARSAAAVAHTVYSSVVLPSSQRKKYQILSIELPL